MLLFLRKDNYNLQILKARLVLAFFYCNRGRIARARSIAADAAPYKEIFIGHSLEEDFIENLNNKADALEQALSNAASQTGKRTGATGKKLLSTKNASKIVKNLDPIVRKRYRDDPAKLAAWNFASHVQRDAAPNPPPNPPA
jgi:hypothetical protein